MTISEMWNKVRQIRGDQETKVSIELWRYSRGISDAIKLTLWDSKRHWIAKDLEDLVHIAEQTMKTPASEAILDSELPDMGKADDQGKSEGN